MHPFYQTFCPSIQFNWLSIHLINSFYSPANRKNNIIIQADSLSDWMFNKISVKSITLINKGVAIKLASPILIHCFPRPAFMQKSPQFHLVIWLNFSVISSNKHTIKCFALLCFAHLPWEHKKHIGWVWHKLVDVNLLLVLHSRQLLWRTQILILSQEHTLFRETNKTFQHQQWNKRYSQYI